jgi:hypothetical protein
LKFLGLFSRVEEIVTEEELTFEEFLKRDFSPTETYKETVTRVKEFDKTCCRPVYATFTVRTLGHPSLNAETDIYYQGTRRKGAIMLCMYSGSETVKVSSLLEQSRHEIDVAFSVN